MTGYELTNRMRKRRRKYPLTATEQALYLELVAICNEDEWDDVFSVSNQELCNALQITEKTLTVARLALIQSGLLYYKSGQSKRQFGKYSFTEPFEKNGTTVNFTTNPTTDPTTDKGGDNTANNTANPTTQATDLNKTETETKPNEEDKGGNGALAPPKKNFIKPSLDEVKNFLETELPANRHIEAIAKNFYNFYQSNGWKVGKTGMKDWQAALRNSLSWDKNKILINATHQQVPNGSLNGQKLGRSALNDKARAEY